MHDENEKLIIDVEALFPAAARRAKILKDLQTSWAGVVGFSLSRHCRPYNLGVNEICIYADSSHSASMIANMKGNILRALNKRYDYESDGEFNLKITRTIPRL